ncbi:MAG: radical SAM protein [Lachnospiraceae bacterium]|nr:radical SAM protein [Lachnospiraceae bacterium]
MTGYMEECRLCPRDCGVNRLAGQRGRCHMTAQISVARAALHMWEEPCISGEEGSGTVFFAGCSLGCVYCQNHEIAAGRAGHPVSAERLAEIFLELQAKRANNINLVTAGHFLPQVALALKLARRRGLDIPVVYNSSGYERVSALKLLEGLVDIYLPDLKYMSPELSGRYSSAPDYFATASRAIGEMVRQAGEASFDSRGMMRRGVIVRHLLLPGCLEDGKAVLRYLYETYGDRIYISILNQYTPLAHVCDWPEINRPVTAAEYDELVDYAIALGVENGFIQEGETVSESFIPAFDGEGVEG